MMDYCTDRELSAFVVGRPSLRLQDQPPTRTQVIEDAPEKAFQASVAPVKVDPFGDAQAQH